MKSLESVKPFIKSNICRIRNLNKEKYTCPICHYNGPFADYIMADIWIIKHSRCPKCDGFERHRLQKLVIDHLQNYYDFSKMRMLHLAPEPFLKKDFQLMFQNYICADLYQPQVDIKVDLTHLPFQTKEFDFVFASHVLEHIKDDLSALSEIKRVLKPGGIAILPVPIVSETTIEYPEPNPFEANHVRAPGFDYYERYNNYFSRIELFSSEDFPSNYQTFIYEDRSIYPTPKCPWRQPMKAEKHLDWVPVCFA